MRYKYQLKFKKIGPIKYLGHIDLLKLFHRSIKRSNLPISYSKGFNPRQLISIALPLPLGMESVYEFCDMEFEEFIENDFLLSRLNEFFPKGIEFYESIALEELSKSTSSKAYACSFDISLPHNKEMNISDTIDKINNTTEIRVMKRTKSGTTETDIKPDIYQLKDISVSLEKQMISITVSAGSERNVNPDLVMEYFYQVCGLAYSKYSLRYMRTEILIK